MGYFDSLKNGPVYIKLAEGLDDQLLIARLNKYLPPGSQVLELGMSSGKDLDILKQSYSVTSSEYPFGEHHPGEKEIDRFVVVLKKTFEVFPINFLRI